MGHKPPRACLITNQPHALHLTQVAARLPSSMPSNTPMRSTIESFWSVFPFSHRCPSSLYKPPPPRVQLEHLLAILSKLPEGAVSTKLTNSTIELRAYTHTRALIVHFGGGDQCPLSSLQRSCAPRCDFHRVRICLARGRWGQEQCL